MGKIIGIDLGTTNSVVAVMEGKEPKVIVNEEGVAPDAVRRGLGRQGRGPGRADRQAPGGHQPREHRLLRQALHGAPLRGGHRGDRSACPSRSCKGKNGDAWFDVRGKEVSPAEVSRQGAAEAEEGRRGLPGREGDRSRHHRARVLQRRAAPGDQGRRQASPGSTSSASSTSRPRRRSRTGSTRRATRSSRSTTSAAAPSTSRSSRSATTSCR